MRCVEKGQSASNLLHNKALQLLWTVSVCFSLAVMDSFLVVTDRTAKDKSLSLLWAELSNCYGQSPLALSVMDRTL